MARLRPSRREAAETAEDASNAYATVTLFGVGALVALGLAAGIVTWRGAPSSYPANDPANNAIMVHWLLAGVAVVATAVAYWRARTRRRSQLLSLPFRQSALRRTAATLRLRSLLSHHLLGLVRGAISLILLYVLLWEPFRAAMQVFAALAPSWTANAWGGPTYWGASLAHWVDGYLLFYAAALLLNIVLVRLPAAEGTSHPPVTPR
jgi:hypothetical protein